MSLTRGPRRQATETHIPGHVGSSNRPVRPCTIGPLMRAPRPYRTAPVGRKTKTQRRKYRLRVGLQRWDQDRQLSAEPTRRLAQLTLTLPAGEPEAAVGLVYRFWARVRRKWLGTRYFCWLELTARGQVHYHCVWLNPPHLKRVDLLRWVAWAWGAGRTQVRFSDGNNGLAREVAYALSYAKKMGKKRYQQRYETVPRELRTFMSQRLEIPGDALDRCRSRDVWMYRPGVPAPDWNQPALPDLLEGYLELIGRWEHAVPAGGRCVANDYRRPKRGPPRPRWDLPPSSRTKGLGGAPPLSVASAHQIDITCQGPG